MISSLNYPFVFSEKLDRVVLDLGFLASILGVEKGRVVGATLDYMARFRKDERLKHVVLDHKKLPAKVDHSAFISVCNILNKNREFSANTAFVAFYFGVKKVLAYKAVAL